MVRINLIPGIRRNIVVERIAHDLVVGLSLGFAAVTVTCGFFLYECVLR
jgi:hypothetical protein